MNDTNNSQRNSLTVSDPDDIGTTNGARNPIRTVLSVFFVSIIACWAAQELLPGSADLLYHVAWLGFHIVFIIALLVLYRVLVKRKQAVTEVY
ncbi:MAG: hypothetical protein ACXAAO_02460 [Candidatus Thorarchaeota archaeon]